jgi:hypothetical protein
MDALRRSRRFLVRAVVVLMLTWLPALIGSLGVTPLWRWAVLSGYLGISWLFPALFVRASVHSWLRARQAVMAMPVGLLAGAAAAAVFLYTAAAIIGG